MSERVKVAIVGGGCAGMTAAFELTRPEHRGRYDVTVYQMGFRLGGKGASGRGQYDRIEEHGLHLWMGFYENAFRVMRECYAELARDPDCPIRTVEEAFSPCPLTGMMDVHDGAWRTWLARFPARPGVPGDPDNPPVWSIGSYLVHCIELVRTVLASLDTEVNELSPPAASSGADMRRFLELGSMATLAAWREALAVLATILQRTAAGPDNLLLSFVGRMQAACAERVAALSDKRELNRLWQIIDLVLAVVRGCIRHRLLTDPRGLDAIDEFDCREWLLANGAERSSVDCSLVRALYDLAFAYEHGDPDKPRIAAGQAIRGALRAFFTYRGAFFYRMNAGMGDIVFAPLYEVLSRRGVKFAFFHRLRNLALGPEQDTPHIAALDFDVQAELRGAAYQPLIDVHGLPCWPNKPLYDQLVDGEALRDRGFTAELWSEIESVRSRRITLKVGEDFDMVVLAVGVGTLPLVTRELAERDTRWRAMLRRTGSVATQALQLWLRPDRTALGWHNDPVNISGYVEPFDTWADMTHLSTQESWPEPPGAIAYFCSVLPDRLAQRPDVHALVTQHARDFLDRDMALLWPRSQRPGPQRGFDWSLLMHPLHGHYARANVDPADRYALALPGSLCFRVSPLDETYDNLSVCGDFTCSGFNEGCVESAVMSGRLAAHALSGLPALKDIVGYDHP